MAIKAFIFDLDGTLLDSEILWCKAIQQLIAARGLPVTESYSCELVYGRAWRDVLSRLRKDYPSIKETDQALEQESQHHYNALHATVDIRIHSSISLLKRLARDYPVAIVSGSTRHQIATAVKLMDISGHIRFYLGNEDYPYGKPDPSGFLLAACHFKVEPEHCLVFEDSTVGVRAAKAAKMHCVALRRKGVPHQDVNEADEVLSDLADFKFTL